MSQMLANPLVLPIVLPLAAGVLCLVLPKVWEKLASGISLLATLATLLLVWRLFRTASGEMVYGKFTVLTIDGLSGFILLATALFGLLISLYSIGFMKDKPRQRDYYAYLLWTVGASCGAVLAGDFIALLVFWGFLGLTLYLMIGIAGVDAAAAAKKTIIIIGGSDSILILGIAALWFLRGTTKIAGDPVVFDGRLAYTAFICLAIAAFTKAGAMPFHSWVPDCGEKAPVPVAAFLPAALDKLLGIYLLVRIVVSIFVMTAGLRAMLMVVGALSIIAAVMMALVQHDMKRLLSYHAVSQVGYMILGIATGVPVAIAGGLFHMLNNVVYKSCLFLCAGAVEQKTGTTDLDSLGGLAKAMPITFLSCVVAAMSISGIPPLNGFASKWMIYQGVVESGKSGGWVWVLCLAAAMLGSALTLASFVKLLHAAFLRKPAPKTAGRNAGEVGFAMWLPMAFLAVTCVFFGVLAYRLPLKLLVLPSLSEPIAFAGTWWAGPATIMLILAFVAGIAFYYFGTASKARVCDTYIGGEYTGKTYVSDEEAGAARDVEVTGVDFYATIREMTPLKQIYRMAEIKLFDIYDVGTHITFGVSKVLQLFHTGVLRSYLAWYVVGLVILLLMMK